MRIQCPACQKAFALDDAKVPKIPSVIKCPSCGGRIPVGPSPEVAAPAPAAPPPPPQTQTAPMAAPAGGGNGAAAAIPHEAMEALRKQVMHEVLKQLGVKVQDEGQGEAVDGDVPTALVCEDEELFQGVIRDALTRMGYRVEVAATTQSAIEAARSGNYYPIITVDNRFPDDPEGGYKILQAINGLPPERRRKMYVAFISADLATMDLNSAFVLGANLTIGKKDVKRLDKILADGIHDNEKRYRVYFQVEEELNNDRL